MFKASQFSDGSAADLSFFFDDVGVDRAAAAAAVHGGGRGGAARQDEPAARAPLHGGARPRGGGAACFQYLLYISEHLL